MKPVLFPLLRVCSLLTAVCLFGPAWATSSLSCLAPHVITEATTVKVDFDKQDGFIIQSGEVRLNPQTHEMEWRGKVAKLNKLAYLMMEELLLADGKPVTNREFSIEGQRRSLLERREELHHYNYDRNWVYVNIMRLKNFLIENFGTSMGDRISNFYGRGFAWTTDKMLEDAKSYDPNKLTYLWNKKRLFKGTTEIALSLNTWLVLDRYVNNYFQMLTRETWMEIWRRTYGKQITSNALGIVITRANQELATLLGTDERVLPKAGIHRVGGWSLESKFFDLNSMPRPIRNSLLDTEETFE